MNTYIGQLLDDRYELLEVIGTGGMAVVYKARCHRLNRFVAVKVLKDEFSGDEEFRRRFRAEGEAVAMLSHPNIVQVFDVSSTDQANFIVMELIDGISLKQYMEVKGILNWKETLHFASQIAKGLEHAHSRGIVHRDIKPHNVMVLKNGSVKVMDFGIAQVMNKSSTLTKEALGSVHYISPEQAKGSYTDNRSDLYSLGVVMYEMMAGRPPYDGESPVAVAIQHINGGAPVPSVYNPNIPTGLEQIIMHCMALDARDRYPSAAELMQDLEEFRKNPAITFQYHSIVDDATKPMKPISVKPRNTAEKIAQSKGGTVSSGNNLTLRKSTGNTGKIRTQNPAPAAPVSGRDQEAARRARQRRREEERIEAERSRVATIAVLACSAVAVISIVVFLVAIFNGALLSRDNELVDVPYLIGEMFTDETDPRFESFHVMVKQQYDDEVKKGQIMSQNPEGRSQVAKGTDLYITVSMGPEPEVKVMEKLTGLTLEQAQAYLTNMGFKTLFWEEPNETLKPGLVIRTDPMEGMELVDGQMIKIWVSTGPDVKTAKMPNVVELDKERALQVLKELGFTEVTVKPVESDKPKDEVVNQSVQATSEIDVTTKIYLDVSEGPKVITARMPDTLGMDREQAQKALKDLGFYNLVFKTVESDRDKGLVVYQSEEPRAEVDVEKTIEIHLSEGPKETVPPTTEAAVNNSGDVTVPVRFNVPVRSEAYQLSIMKDGAAIVSGTIQAGQSVFVTDLTGSGTQEYHIWINGEFNQVVTVKFNG